MRPDLSLTARYAEARWVSEVAGRTLAETTFAADARMPRHEHELAHFYLVIRGACADTVAPRNPCCMSRVLTVRPSINAQRQITEKETAREREVDYGGIVSVKALAVARPVTPAARTPGCETGSRRPILAPFCLRSATG